MARNESTTRSGFWPQYWQLLEPFRSRLFRVLMWILAMQALALIEPTIIMAIIDDIVKHGSKAESRLLPLAAGGLIALMLIGLVKLAKDKRISRINGSLYHDIQVDCGRKLLSLPLDYHLRTNTGEIVGKVTRGTGKIVELTHFVLLEIVPLIAQTLLSTAVLLYLHPLTTLALLPPILAFAWMTHRLKRKTQPSRRERHGYDRKADARLGQAVTNVMTVQAFGQEGREHVETSGLRDRFYELFRNEIDIQHRTELARNAAISIGRICLIVVCARAVFGNTVTIGMMILMVTLAERIFINCYRFGGIYDRMMDAEEPVWNIIELMKEREIRRKPETIDLPPGMPDGDIEIRDVSFAYTREGKDETETRTIWALRDIRLSVRPGQMLGVVGPSGGGKSTLAKLLLRFHDPASGTIRIHGRDIQRMQLDDLRSTIGFVPQEVELFDDTIRANIAYGDPKAIDHDIEAAAKAAHAHDFIMEAGGYDTVIGDRGLKLSGGQRQRIGIARALLCKPKLLILDEATSSVDPETIWEIKQAMNKVRGTCTMVVVSHQLSTIQDADMIAVIKDGRIDGLGKHHELVKRNAVYRGLVHRQQELDAASRYIDPSMLS